MASFTHRTPQNPNEAYGVRACSAAGHQKHVDCSGEWTELLGVRSALGVPHIVICDAHLRGLVPNLHDGSATYVPAAKPRARKRKADDEVPLL